MMTIRLPLTFEQITKVREELCNFPKSPNAEKYLGDVALFSRKLASISRKKRVAIVSEKILQALEGGVLSKEADTLFIDQRIDQKAILRDVARCWQGEANVEEAAFSFQRIIDVVKRLIFRSEVPR